MNFLTVIIKVFQDIRFPYPITVLNLCSLPGIAKAHGVQLKASGAMLRLRLYQALSLLDPSAYEGVYIKNR